MINNIELHNVNYSFQEKLKNDINEVKMCHKVLTSADKSRNLYKLEKVQYEQLLKENITKK